MPTYSCGVDNSLTFASDPSAVDGINATAVFGGIRVRWSLPGTNPHAVSQYHLLRGPSSNISSATQIAAVGATSYFDQVSGSHYYWVRSLSVNGTESGWVGPAHATAGTVGQDILQHLSGQILSSHLAASLRTEIEDIPDLRNQLLDENSNRIIAVQDLETRLGELGLNVDEAFTSIINERTLRQDGMNALAESVTGIAASNGQNWGAILTEQSVRISETQSLTESIETQASTFQGQLGRVESAIQTAETTLAEDNAALAQRIDTLVVNLGTQFGAIQNDQIVSIDEEGAVVAAKDTLQLSIIRPVQDRIDDEVNPAIAGVDGKAADAQGTADRAEGKADDAHDRIDAVPQVINAAIDDYSVTRAGYCVLPNGDISEANDVGECNAVGGEWKPWLAIADDQKRLSLAIGDPGENEMSIAQRMTISEDELGRLQGKYTIKINTTRDGQKLMGGFGIANEFASNDPDGPEAATDDIIFGVVADKFFIAQPHENVLLPGTGVNGVAPQILPERMPFIVDGGTVYMNSAYIKDLSVDTLKINKRAISSERYSLNSSKCFVVNYNAASQNKYRRSLFQATSLGSLQLLTEKYSNSYISYSSMPSSDYPELVFDVDGEIGENYEIELYVEFQVGIRVKNADRAYAIGFVPIIEWKWNYHEPGGSEGSALVHFPYEIVRAAECYPIKIFNFTGTKLFQVDTNAEITLAIGPISSMISWSGSSNWGTYAPTSDLVEFAFVQDIYMSAKYLKR